MKKDSRFTTAPISKFRRAEEMTTRPYLFCVFLISVYFSTLLYRNKLRRAGVRITAQLCPHYAWRHCYTMRVLRGETSHMVQHVSSQDHNHQQEKCCFTGEVDSKWAKITPAQSVGYVQGWNWKKGLNATVQVHASTIIIIII